MSHNYYSRTSGGRDSSREISHGTSHRDVNTRNFEHGNTIQYLVISINIVTTKLLPLTVKHIYIYIVYMIIYC